MTNVKKPLENKLHLFFQSFNSTITTTTISTSSECIVDDCYCCQQVTTKANWKTCSQSLTSAADRWCVDVLRNLELIEKKLIKKLLCILHQLASICIYFFLNFFLFVFLSCFFLYNFLAFPASTSCSCCYSCYPSCCYFKYCIHFYWCYFLFHKQNVNKC